MISICFEILKYLFLSLLNNKLVARYVESSYRIVSICVQIDLLKYFNCDFYREIFCFETLINPSVMKICVFVAGVQLYQQVPTRAGGGQVPRLGQVNTIGFKTVQAPTLRKHKHRSSSSLAKLHHAMLTSTQPGLPIQVQV